MTANNDEVHEPEVGISALQAMRSRPNGLISVTDLIDELMIVFQPTGKDLELSANRKDTRFSQKVRNIVSHRDRINRKGNIIHDGYARYDPPNSK